MTIQGMAVFSQEWQIPQLGSPVDCQALKV